MVYCLLDNLFSPFCFRFSVIIQLECIQPSKSQYQIRQTTNQNLVNLTSKKTSYNPTTSSSKVSTTFLMSSKQTSKSRNRRISKGLTISRKQQAQQENVTRYYPNYVLLKSVCKNQKKMIFVSQTVFLQSLQFRVRHSKKSKNLIVTFISG